MPKIPSVELLKHKQMYAIILLIEERSFGMNDTSLLNKDGPITLEDLREHFRLNDFSAMSSGYNKGKESQTKPFHWKNI